MFYKEISSEKWSDEDYRSVIQETATLRARDFMKLGALPRCQSSLKNSSWNTRNMYVECKMTRSKNSFFLLTKSFVFFQYLAEVQGLLDGRDVMAEEQLRKEMVSKGKFLGELGKRFGTRASNSSTTSG